MLLVDTSWIVGGDPIVENVPGRNAKYRSKLKNSFAESTVFHRHGVVRFREIFERIFKIYRRIFLLIHSGLVENLEIILFLFI